MASKDSFSFKFFIIPQASGVMAKIFLRITVDRKKAEIYTGHTVLPEHWNEEQQQSEYKKDKALNEDLVGIKNEIIAVKRRLQYENKPISAKVIKDIYTGASEVKHTLFDYYRQYLEQIEKLTKEYSKGTVKNYRVTYRHLQNFLASRKVKDLPLTLVDNKFANDFDFHLMTYVNPVTKVTMDRNTANRQHNRLKTILNKAVREGILDKSPYDNFKLKDNATNREFLTEEELELLKHHPLGGNKSLQRVRDIFLFSVYTGLRFGDAQQLKLTHVRKDKEGKYWIEKAQEKTTTMLRIPMLRPAVTLFEKYDCEERKITGFILPRISNQKVNAYLKIVAELTGISKQLTHHVARHTFATTITLSNDVPLEIVSKLMGHTSIRTTQIYAKITDKFLSEITTRLDEKF